MLLFALAYLGGILTILSPCILPVLPFVFARSDRPFLRSGLPLLGGMAITFALVASLAAVAGGWAVAANVYGRLVAITLLAVFGVFLLLPGLSDRATRPLVALGSRLSAHAPGGADGTVLSSALLGVATGLLWAPCAGPILGLILTGAALQGASVHTTVLLLCYALGAATSLALALLVGGRVFALMKRSLGVGEWVRRGLGVAVLAAVVVVAFGFDTGVLARVSAASTAALESRLVDRLGAAPAAAASAGTGSGNAMATAVLSTGEAVSRTADSLPVEGLAPSLDGAVAWLNTPPLTTQALRGKVVLVDFWTYSCINCLRAIPYVKAWAEQYKDQGLVVIGVHAPEFAFERDIDNVRRATSDLAIGYPIAIDNDYRIWRAFSNRFWPAHYFIDAKGRIRYHHFGEGDYAGTERVIQRLLAEAGATPSAALVSVAAAGAQAAPDLGDVRSPETYVGYGRAERFVSPGGLAHDMPQSYAAANLRLNEWGLEGAWTVGDEQARLDAAGGGIIFRFHARDLHLVLGPSVEGHPIRFRVTIDGAPPGVSHGLDVDAQGQGTVDRHRLFQLVRQGTPVTDHAFEIRFIDAGVRAYAFTFG